MTILPDYNSMDTKVINQHLILVNIYCEQTQKKCLLISKSVSTYSNGGKASLVGEKKAEVDLLSMHAVEVV